MDIYSLPGDLNADSGDSITILSAQSTCNSVKSRITLHQHLFSFPMEGTKSLSYSDKTALIDNTQFLLLSAGNCLMSEKIAPEKGTYRSILIFFDNSELASFFIKHTLDSNIRNTYR